MLLAVNSAASPVRRHTTRRFAWVFRTAVIVALLHVVAVGAPGAALAHDVNTAAGHEAEDAVVHSATTEARLNRETLLLSSWASAATAAAVAADPGQVGQWGAGRQLARRRHPRGASSERQGARLGLGRRCSATETLPGPHLHASHRLRPGHGHADAGRRSTRVTTSSAPGSRTSSTAPCSSPAATRTQQLKGIVTDPSVQPGHQRLEPRSRHGGRSLVSVGHAADQRRDAHHRGRSRHPGGAEDRRDPADAEHGVDEPAALSVDGRRSRRPRLLRGARPDAAQARPDGRRLVAELRPARRHQPELRQPRALRHRQDARGRRRVVVEQRVA